MRGPLNRGHLNIFMKNHGEEERAGAGCVSAAPSRHRRGGSGGAAAGGGGGCEHRERDPDPETISFRE